MTGNLQAAGVSDLDYLREQEAAVQAAEALPIADPAREGALVSASQILAQALAIVGEHTKAERVFEEAHYGPRGKALPIASDIKLEDVEYARTLLAETTPVPAVAAIVRASANRQIVILNEAHQLSRHRAFGMQLALALRKAGFKYLALETLNPAARGLAQRGYPVRDDGWYSNDPVFGDFIRQALRAGYVPVAYEQTTEQTPRTDDWTVRIDSREENEANNLVQRTLEVDHRARILVYVGFGHVQKGTDGADPDSRRMMAERLRAKTGIDPLCIDETHVAAPLPGTRDRALLDAIFAKTREDVVVLADSSKPGGYYAWDHALVDMQVFHRPATTLLGRQTWLSMAGYRKPRAIPDELLPASGRRLIQAFVAGESADGVPMDQVLVTAGEKPPVFMLSKGRYRFAYQD